MPVERDVRVRLQVVPEGTDRVQTALAGLTNELTRQQQAAKNAGDAIAKAVSLQVPGGIASAPAAAQKTAGVSPAAGAAAAEAGGGGGIMAALLPVAGIVASIVGAVQAANPAVVEKLGQAFKDTLAVLGDALIPVVQIFTQSVRLLGDFLNSVIPSQAQMTELMKGLDPIFKAIQDVLQRLAPVVKSLISSGLQALVPVIQVVAAYVNVLMAVLAPLIDLLGGMVTGLAAGLAYLVNAILQPLIWLVNKLADALRWLMARVRDVINLIPGVELKETAPTLRSSVGAAAAPASFIGVGELGQRAQQAAFSIGARSVEENTRKGADFTERLYGLVSDLAREFAKPEGKRSPEVEGVARALAAAMGGR
jgi:hypothetical protein